MKAFDYVAPRSLAEAVEHLKVAGGKGRALAGGTDLLPQMKYQRRSPSLIVDVKGLPELQRLELSSDGLHIGAAVPLAVIARHAAVLSQYSVIAHSCARIGSVQVRNRGTLGGNICNAAPSADGVPGLLCLGAKAAIAGPQGRRQVDLEDFFLGPGATVLAGDELLVEVVVPPPPPDSGACYLLFSPRAEMDIASAGAASLLAMSRDGECLRARIALSAVAPTPLRARAAEAILEGSQLSPMLLERAAVKAAEEARPISDLRASASYRRELVRVLTLRSLESNLKALGRLW